MVTRQNLASGRWVWGQDQLTASSESDRLGKQLHSNEWHYWGFSDVGLQVNKSNAASKNRAGGGFINISYYWGRSSYNLVSWNDSHVA